MFFHVEHNGFAIDRKVQSIAKPHAVLVRRVIDQPASRSVFNERLDRLSICDSRWLAVNDLCDECVVGTRIHSRDDRRAGHVPVPALADGPLPGEVAEVPASKRERVEVDEHAVLIFKSDREGSRDVAAAVRFWIRKDVANDPRLGTRLHRDQLLDGRRICRRRKLFMVEGLPERFELSINVLIEDVLDRFDVRRHFRARDHSQRRPRPPNEIFVPHPLAEPDDVRTASAHCRLLRHVAAGLVACDTTETFRAGQVLAKGDGLIQNRSWLLRDGPCRSVGRDAVVPDEVRDESVLI